MGSGVMSETIIIIASVILAGSLAAVMLSYIGIINSSVASSSQVEKQVILTHVKIIFATNSSSTSVTAWVKNIGSIPITQVNQTDVYFGPIGSIQRIPYNSGSAYWSFTNYESTWPVMGTVGIQVINSSPLSAGTTYEIMVSTPNGVNDHYIFAMN